MKRSICIASLLLCTLLIRAEILTIGTGSSQQNFPLGSYHGYIRSASLYTDANLGDDNLEIEALSWYCNIATTAVVPTRIYLKSSSITTFTACTWAEMISDASLVYDGVHAGTQAGAWNTFTLDQSFRIDEGQALLVLVERNFGGYGSGNAGGNHTGAAVQATFFWNSNLIYHQTWTQSYAPPLGEGTLSNYRPDLQVTYNPYSGNGLPYPTSPAYPSDGQQNVQQQSVLRWARGSCNPSGYKLYLGQETPPNYVADLGPVLSYVPDSLSFGTTYYWKVVPYNAFGDAANCPLWSFQVRPDSLISSFPHVQDFDDAWIGFPPAPLDWKVVNADGDLYTWSQGGGSISPTHSAPWAALGSGLHNDWMISPPICLEDANVLLEWWERISEAGSTHSYKLMLSTTGRELSDFTVELGDYTCSIGSWQKRSLSLLPYLGETVFLAFRKYESSSGGFGIDDFTLIEIHAADLTTTVSGSASPFLSFPAQVTVRVENQGYQSQSGYTVQLFSSSHQLLDTASGPPLEPGASTQVSLIWTPEIAGADSIYANVLLPQGTNPSNGQNPWLPVQVLAHLPYQASIGSGGTPSNIPINFGERAALFQTLYHREEVGNWGEISELQLQYDFNSNILDQPVKIWLGMTDRNDLSPGWIPSTEMNLVYDGQLNFPSAQHLISIPLDTPFKYCDGSLVLMIQRPWEFTFHGSSQFFRCQSDLADRSRYAGDWNELDVDNPAGNLLSAIYPKLGLQISPLSLVPEILVFPSFRDFGQLAMGSYLSQSFKICNAGLGTLLINAISISDTEDFVLEALPTLPFSVELGHSAQVDIRCQPVSPGAHNATISLDLTPGGEDLQIPLTVNANNTITLGEGGTAEHWPLGLNFKNSLCESVHSAASMNHFSGVISSLKFFHMAASASLAVPMKVWLGNTNSSDLSPGWIPASELTLVFDGIATLAAGSYELELIFPTPYVHPGGNLVVLAYKAWEAQIPTNYPRFYHQIGSENMSRYLLEHDNLIDPLNISFAGAATNLYPKTKFVVASAIGAPEFQLLPQELGLVSVAGGRIEKTISINNIGGRILSIADLSLSGNPALELTDLPPLPHLLHSAETLLFKLCYSPTDGQAIPGTITVDYILDPQTDPIQQSFQASINCQAHDDILIGSGNILNNFPIYFGHQSSWYQTLYYPQELDNFRGQIQGIEFFNSFSSNLLAKPTQIWMGTTSLPDLAGGPIPSTELSLVFSGNVDYPSGQNTISIDFPEPFLYLDNQNLVMLVYRPLDTETNTQTNNFRCQNGLTQRAWTISSSTDYILPESPVGGYASVTFPKTKFITQPRFGAPQFHLTSYDGEFGDVLLGQTVTKTYTISNGGAGSFNLASLSLSGSDSFTLSYDQTLPLELDLGASFQFFISLTAQQPGLQEAVLNISDSLPARRQEHSLALSGRGLRGVQAGNGNEVSRMPVAMNYRNSVYETIYQSAELSGLDGYITGIIWQYRFMDELLQKPIKIWLGSTNSDDLTGGWIPPSQLSLVYDGLKDFHPGAHALEIGFDTPFPYQEGNLVMMVQRPMDTEYFSAFNQFFCTTEGVNRSCKIQSDTVSYDPENLPTSGFIRSGQYPNTTFLYRDNLLITVSGRVLASQTMSGITGATISLSGDQNYQTTSIANGEFQFPSVLLMAEYQYSVSAPGYQPLAGTITLGATDYTMGDLLLQEAILPPGEASATLDILTRIAEISWTAASPTLMISKAAPGRPATRSQRAHSPSSRALEGYIVSRMALGAEDDPSQWNLLCTLPATQLSVSDSLWIYIPTGDYRWAVQALYTTNQPSAPSFTNILSNQIISGTLCGTVRGKEQQPVPGATVSVGDYSTETDQLGWYELFLFPGVHEVTISASEYKTQSHSGITILPAETFTLDVDLVPVNLLDEFQAPALTMLKGNFPNPFRLATEIHYSLKEAGPVSVEIYDLKGRLLKTLRCDAKAGEHSIGFSARDEKGLVLPAGVYLYRFKTGNYRKTGKMLLLH